MGERILGKHPSKNLPMVFVISDVGTFNKIFAHPPNMCFIIAACRVDVLKDLFFDRISCINVINMKKICSFREIAAAGHLFWIGGCGFGQVKRSIPNRLMERMRQTRTQGQEQAYRGSMKRLSDDINFSFMVIHRFQPQFPRIRPNLRYNSHVGGTHHPCRCSTALIRYGIEISLARRGHPL